MSICVASAALAIAVAACQSPVPSGPVATDTPPIGGSLHLTTGPDYDAHDPLELRYIDVGGASVGPPTSIDAETKVSVDVALPAGLVHVLANGTACAGDIGIKQNVEVDVVLSASDGRCTIAIADTHPQGAVTHPEPPTAIGAFVVPDSVLAARPLDPGNAIAPIRKPADGNAEVLPFAVPPGRYELSVLVDGVVLTAMEIEIKRGQEFYYTLRVVAATVPRICGAIARQQCEEAITAAYSGGLFPPMSSTNLRSVRVRPSTNSGCYEAPVFDVMFDTRDLADPLEVTVATAGGRLLACTY